jgi:hypothetical protein
MPAPSGFTYEVLASGQVVVSHNGAIATTLRGWRAEQFLDEIDGGGDAQELLARLTGNYKRGNERTASQHPRNRHRR